MVKTKYALVSLIMVAAGLVILGLVIRNEGNKEIPPERYIRQQASGTEQTLAEEEKKTKLTYEGMEYEFLSYEVIADEDIAAQTKYDADNFYDGEVPDPNELEQYLDWEALLAEAPQELLDVIDVDRGGNGNSSKYSEKEQERIFEDNASLYEKHTHMIHRRTNYVFVKSRITNTTGQEREISLHGLYMILSSSDKERWDMQESMCYFDHATHTEGDDRIHQFFWHTFQPGETLECTIGFTAKEYEEYGENEVWLDDVEYYVGLYDDLAMDIGYKYNKNMVKLSDLEEIGEE